METKNKKISIGVAAAIAIVATLALSGCGFKQTNPNQYKMKLEVWGLFDDRDAFNDLIENYKRLNPNVVEVEYKKLMPDTYKKDVIEALASGQGPDIFLIQNTWAPGFADKIVPAPAEILNEKTFRENFVDVAAADFLNQSSIYAVPLSVDSLALYYNKDLFNQAGLTAPPRDWNEFVEDSKLLTKVNNFGEIIQSGAAMGTANNINRAADIVSLLMLQTKAEMVDVQSGRAKFDQTVQGDVPGENALSFYAQFAKSSSATYSWNFGMHYSLDAFAEGTLAMMINYSWHMDTIASKAPKLNFAAAPVPQLGGEKISYANYWGYAVAKNKNAVDLNAQSRPLGNDTRVKEAWKFLNYLTIKPDKNALQQAAGNKKGIDLNFDPAISYLQKTGKPAARKDVIEMQKSDSKIGVFAESNLVAKSWYQEDPDAVDGIFMEMIDRVNRGQSSVTDALKNAAEKVSRTMVR